jgi:hypothetical protein
MAVPVAVAVKAGVPAIDRAAGINTGVYTRLWSGGIPPIVQSYFDNISAWNWGVTDPGELTALGADSAVSVVQCGLCSTVRSV